MCTCLLGEGANTVHRRDDAPEWYRSQPDAATAYEIPRSDLCLYLFVSASYTCYVRYLSAKRTYTREMVGFLAYTVCLVTLECTHGVHLLYHCRHSAADRQYGCSRGISVHFCTLL